MSDAQSEKISGQKFFWVCLAVLAAAAALAVSGQSLWIDEANTAFKARQPTLSGWWQTLAAEKATP